MPFDSPPGRLPNAWLNFDQRGRDVVACVPKTAGGPSLEKLVPLDRERVPGSVQLLENPDRLVVS